MKAKRFTIGVIIIVMLILSAGIFYWWSNVYNIDIESIKLTSPYNSPLFENIEVKLDKPAAVYIEYWEDGSAEKFHTLSSSKKAIHTIHLLLLKPATTYHYQVVINKFFKLYAKADSFHTRKQSPWMVHNWIKKHHPHNANALGNGMVMLCYGGTPGYIAMVDAQGTIRWYWQVDDTGVRAATLTPRGTILALLHHPLLDEINDVPNKAEKEKLNKMNSPIRRGRIGYVGGTALAEIDLTGHVLWRININKDSLGYEAIHHDLRMDKENHILTFIRQPLVYDTTRWVTGEGKDTLWGDALVKIDTTGKILWKWSAWKNWDIKEDPKIKKLAYDRFHMNALYITKDSNYLISSALENQIWKINSKSGKLMWKFGKNGNFKMDTSNYFAFQHDVNVNPNGDMMIFDNGDFTPFNKSADGKNSRVLAFHLDTSTMTASTKLDIQLPHALYSSRMGSAYMLPNKNLLITSAKTGTVIVTSPKGKILWELNTYFIPYRAEYIPEVIWNKFFVHS